MQSVENLPEKVLCPEAKRVYWSLLHDNPDDLAVARSRSYLVSQLRQSALYDADLPESPDALRAWSATHTARVGVQYRQYLDARKAGGPRQYFTTKSHALCFLKSVAPTKLVDGAWLYGLLEHWDDARFSVLIQTYLEELGEGLPGKNHVVIYKKLLATYGCEQWETLSNAHFVQGAIQLALAQHTAHFLPEVIGFNLGYEQLPLHLLICAYELNELGIDPYYFTLHITVDNAASGHATKAIKGLFDALPHIGDKKVFYQRVVNGYKLNLLGAGTNSVIAQFDLGNELLAILASKCGVGSQLHSDYCHVSGKSVNEWLSDPVQLPAFLDSLEHIGWIKRHQDPENSRFWQLIQGETAAMFGVFNAYERQVVHDWIAGNHAVGASSRQLSYKARQRLLDTLEQGEHFPGLGEGADQSDDINVELRLLAEKLAAFPSKDAAMGWLTPLMSPVRHHTAAGLMATRIFTRMFGNE